MWINFNCSKCGRLLDYYQQSHDSGEFIMSRTNFECKCEDFQVKITYHRG